MAIHFRLIPKQRQSFAKMKFLMSQWKLFTVQTGIKAFAFVANSKYRWETVVWAIALIVGTVYTTVDVCHTWETFQSRPTITNMIMNADSPIKIPHLKFGLIYSKPQSFKLFSGDINANVMNFLNGTDRKINLDETQDINEIDKEMLSAAVYLVSVISSAELHDLTKETGWGAVSEDLLIRFVNAFINLFPSDNNNYGKVVKAIGFLLWKSMELEIWSTKQYANKTVLKPLTSSNVTWIGSSPGYAFGQLGLQIAQEQLHFYNRHSSVNIRFNHKTIFNPVDAAESSVNFGHVYVVLYLGPNFIFSPEAQNIMEVKVDTTTAINLAIAGRYKSMPSGRTGCTDEHRSHQECSLQCRKRYIEETINCSPLFGAFTTFEGSRSNLQLCNYQIHLNSTIVFSSIIHCDEACSQPCERYIFTMERDPKSVSIAQNTTLIRVRFNSFIFPEFHEILALDTAAFLSRLGGNLSLWIGASFLVLLHLAVFIVRIPIDYYYGVNHDDGKLQDVSQLKSAAVGDINGAIAERKHAQNLG